MEYDYVRLRLILKPGADDDLIECIESLPLGKRSAAMRQALRAYLSAQEIQPVLEKALQRVLPRMAGLLADELLRLSGSEEGVPASLEPEWQPQPIRPDYLSLAISRDAGGHCYLTFESLFPRVARGLAALLEVAWTHWSDLKPVGAPTLRDFSCHVDQYNYHASVTAHISAATHEEALRALVTLLRRCRDLYWSALAATQAYHSAYACMLEGMAEMTIVELGVSCRVRNALTHAGYHAVFDVMAALVRGDEELLAIRGFGPKALHELREALRARGVHLPGETGSRGPAVEEPVKESAKEE